jgi:hypothetical protein
MTESAVEFESLISKMAFGSVKEGAEPQTDGAQGATNPAP